MKVLLSWLKEFVEVPAEPKRLGERLTLAGLAVDSLESDGKDTLLDIDVTTNRVDCMNVYGVAREVSVIYDVPLRQLALGVTESGPAASQDLDVTIEAPDLCPRFCARVLDVRLGPSPEWIRDRLEAVGVRPINNVVDLTNYVMLEMGHPSHAFDLARIPEGGLRVRWAREGERLTTLDGVDRTLTGRAGVVAGPSEPLALAGIMGGAASEVSHSTRTVALEAAYWEPRAIRRAAKAMGMHTEASHRFERGADPEGPPVATARIAHLLQKIGAGGVRPGVVDRIATARPGRSVTLRPSKMWILLGTEVPEEKAHRILLGLGFGLGGRDGEGTVVDVPSWRGDVSREADIIEEVGRHHGLDTIPTTLPPAGEGVGLRPFQARERTIRESLVGSGLTEVISYAFVSPSAGEPTAARVELDNPLSEDQSVLRGSLVVPGLFTTLTTNLRQGRRDVRLFEVGRVFIPSADLPVEERRLGILLAGAARPPHWSESPHAADFFDLKGILETLAGRLGIGVLGWGREEGIPAFLHPGKSALVRRGEQLLGYLGAVHPDVAAAWGFRDEVVVAELRLDAILSWAPGPVRFRALDRFPAVSRDLSIVWDAELSAAELESRIRNAAGDLLRSVAVVDRYDRPPVPEGKVSLTVKLRFQDPARTLTGQEVQGAVERVVQGLRAGGAEIRGE